MLILIEEVVKRPLERFEKTTKRDVNLISDRESSP
jgi:hypothetical protein